MHHFKALGKRIVLAVLSAQAKRLQAKARIKTVGVVGSYGKTSTKLAVAKVLQQSNRVRFQDGNYNDIVTVPLIFFGETMPSLLNPLAWLALFMRNERQLRRPYPYDIVVLEIGTDGPGQIEAFKRYLHLDFTIVTAIGDEHMEFFADLDAVAKEELSVAVYSDTLIINTDLCASGYLSGFESESVIRFGYGQDADYRLDNVRSNQGTYTFDVLKNRTLLLKATYSGVAKAQLYSACAAAVVGEQLGMTTQDIATGIANVQAASGRMQTLRGLRGSTILDESYNASPEATKAALDVLYDMKAPQKIALLGNMNELGKYSRDAHLQIGAYCDADQLDLVVTIGPDANQYLAQAARDRGCAVHEFTNPVTAGEFIVEQIKKEAVILVKGSQNGVFAEEAIKVILDDPQDATKLVRQSKAWLKKKAKAGFAPVAG